MYILTFNKAKINNIILFCPISFVKFMIIKKPHRKEVRLHYKLYYRERFISKQYLQNPLRQFLYTKHTKLFHKLLVWLFYF